MSGSIPMFTIVTASGSQIPGGWDLSLAIEGARQTEADSRQTVVRIMQGANVVLEGQALRHQLD